MPDARRVETSKERRTGRQVELPTDDVSLLTPVNRAEPTKAESNGTQEKWPVARQLLQDCYSCAATAYECYDAAAPTTK